MTIHLLAPLEATPSPTSLRRRIDFTVRIFSDSPPENAVFEYTSHRQDVYFEEGSPMVREETVESGQDDPAEIHHRLYLDKLPGTQPSSAPISLEIRSENGTTVKTMSVIELK